MELLDRVCGRDPGWTRNAPRRIQVLSNECNALYDLTGGVTVGRDFTEQQPSVVDLHPNLPALYRRKVHELQASLNSPTVRQEASEILRSLIERVLIHPEPKRGAVQVELRGQIASILEFANRKNTTGTEVGLMLVAVEGLEPPTQGL